MTPKTNLVDVSATAQITLSRMTGDDVNSKPVEEWEAMSEQTQQEIRARLHAAVADVEANILRGKLARASRSGLAGRLEH